MKSFFNKLSIHTQVLFLLIILLSSCIMLGITINHVIHNLLLENVKGHLNRTAQELNLKVDELFSRVDSISRLLQSDSELESYFLSPSATSELTLDPCYKPLLSVYEEISDVGLIDPNLKWSLLFSKTKLEEFSKNITVSKLTSLGFHISEVPTSNKLYAVFGKKIYGLSNREYFNQPIGNIILSVDLSKASMAINSPKDYSSHFLLVDEQFHTYSFDNTFTDTQALVSQLKTYVEHTFPNKELFFELDNKDYFIFASYNPNTKYYAISATSKDYFYQVLRYYKIPIYIVWGIATILILCIGILILNNLVFPLHRMYQFMHHISQGDERKLKSSIHLNGCKEIYGLSITFNEMLNVVNLLNERILKQTTDLYEMELQKQTTEISHLRSQINPHFLYNTLEMLKGIALEHHVPKISSICTSMGKIFRYSIKGSDLVPLQDELTIAKAYIDIQVLRFEGRFQVFYSIHPSTESLLIIKMLLQPIIENAIIHGLEPSTRPGILYIGSKIIEDNLMITIQDNGVGISHDKLSNLQSQLTTCSSLNGNHIGIINVHRRIQLYYGAHYGLHINSQANEGTTITFTLPIQKGE
nr:histidine kinase [uncultured Niameybacter sp.]